MCARQAVAILIGMWECRVSIDIDRSPEAVFTRLKDLRRHGDFSDGLASVEMTSSGALGVGSQFRAGETVPSRFVSFSEITALDEPRLIAWKAWVPHVMRTRWRFDIERRDGGTRLTQTSQWEAAGPPGWLMLNLHRKRHVPEENRRTLARIKEVLEAEGLKEAAS